MDKENEKDTQEEKLINSFPKKKKKEKIKTELSVKFTGALEESKAFHWFLLNAEILMGNSLSDEEKAKAILAAENFRKKLVKTIEATKKN